MPFPNRITPFGGFTAVSTRGLLMGNRGRLHDKDQRLGSRRWASRAWICCQCEFKDRHRKVWGDGYTELFFLDEPTALAAGHRPCFECRRADALAFAEAWAQAHGSDRKPSAGEMDDVLHAQRLDERAKRLHPPQPDLPDGSFVTLVDDPNAYAVRHGRLLRWSHEGYVDAGALGDARVAAVITPPATIAVLARGYAPQWHSSAD